MDINPILLDLEIIKQIGENDKLGINILPGQKRLFVDQSNYLTPVKRWYNGYNREDSINYLDELTFNIEKSCEFLINGSHEDLSQTLKKAIKSGLNGIQNLKNTYINDSIINAKLYLIINKLNKAIVTLETDLPNFSMSVINEIENS